jgi:hypothetical protein
MHVNGDRRKNLLSSFDLLNTESVFVDGDPQYVFTGDFAESYLIINPHKAVEWARHVIAVSTDYLDTDTFRLQLIKKSKLMKG